MDLPGMTDLEFFDGVATAGTLTGAARQWGVSTSAVSKRLAHLERRLGAQLVNRSTRRLSLTDEGARYAAGAARLLPLITDLEDDVGRRQGVLRGRLAVQCTIGLGRALVAPILGDFTRMHPGVELELELSQVPLHIAGTPFDFAVRVGRQRDSRLRTRMLHPNRRVLCASPGYVAARGAPGTLAELADHDCIVIRETDTEQAVWRFGTDAEETTVKVPGTMISNDGDVATQWCVEGHGLLMRSLWHVGPMLRDGSLVQVLDDVPTPSANISAIYASSHNLPRRAQAALDHVATELTKRMAGVREP